MVVGATVVVAIAEPETLKDPADAAGITLLQVIGPEGMRESLANAAAILAEDLAPRPEST